MTKEDVGVMLGMIREVYGKSGESPNPKLAIEIWYSFLCDEHKDLVKQALDRHIASNTFAPRPAEILGTLEDIKWEIYAKNESARSLGNDVKIIPPEFMPRSITRAPKQYEITDKQRIFESLGDLKKLGDGK